ncbi:Diacylglycerol kinase eta [Lamellibrachia satsuma]|nr:Diacylglycerol kinase eta [Lamellibrachia satsuma]
MGGINFWGSSKHDDNFVPVSFDDKILEVVAVFGGVQLGISRVINLQHHRIAQCRSVKITIMGEEGVPVQVDGEAWIQPPGHIKIKHKNRSQMLIRDKVFEEALKVWRDKQKIETPVDAISDMLSEDETQILHSFIDATQMLIKSVKVASICHSTLEQDLFHLATQASGFLDRLYPCGRLSQPAIRTQVSDLVSSVRTLYNETNLCMTEKANTVQLRHDVEEKLTSSLAAMEAEMRKVYEIGGLPHFQAIQQEGDFVHDDAIHRHAQSKWELQHELQHMEDSWWDAKANKVKHFLIEVTTGETFSR